MNNPNMKMKTLQKLLKLSTESLDHFFFTTDFFPLFFTTALNRAFFVFLAFPEAGARGGMVVADDVAGFSFVDFFVDSAVVLTSSVVVTLSLVAFVVIASCCMQVA